MKNSLNRLTTALACAALIVGLTLPAQAAETTNPIRVSSYKGSALQVGDRSGLIISGAAQSVASDSPEIVAVENVSGFWVAVAKSDGTAVLIATDSHGETASLTLTVGDPTPYTSVASVPVTELDEVRREIIRLANEVRRENGVKELPVNEALMTAAQTCSEQGLRKHDMQYEGETVLASGYPYGFNSNLTCFSGVSKLQNIAETAVTNWVNSSGHFQTMIDPSADCLGVGVVVKNNMAYCYMMVGDASSHNPYE